MDVGMQRGIGFGRHPSAKDLGAGIPPGHYSVASRPPRHLISIGPKTGHPLEEGHWSTEKTLSAPVLVPVLTEALSGILQAVIEPAFSFVSIPYLPRRPIGRRGEPFGHSSGSSA